MAITVSLVLRVEVLLDLTSHAEHLAGAQTAARREYVYLATKGPRLVLEIRQCFSHKLQIVLTPSR